MGVVLGGFAGLCVCICVIRYPSLVCCGFGRRVDQDACVHGVIIHNKDFTYLASWSRILVFAKTILSSNSYLAPLFGLVSESIVISSTSIGLISESIAISSSA